MSRNRFFCARGMWTKLGLPRWQGVGALIVQDFFAGSCMFVFPGGWVVQAWQPWCVPIWWDCTTSSFLLGPFTTLAGLEHFKTRWFTLVPHIRRCADDAAFLAKPDERTIAALPSGYLPWSDVAPGVSCLAGSQGGVSNFVDEFPSFRQILNSEPWA